MYTSFQEFLGRFDGNVWVKKSFFPTFYELDYFTFHDNHFATAVKADKGVEHISTIVSVNIWMARVRVPLVLSVGI